MLVTEIAAQMTACYVTLRPHAPAADLGTARSVENAKSVLSATAKSARMTSPVSSAKMATSL